MALVTCLAKLDFLLMYILWQKHAVKFSSHPASKFLCSLYSVSKMDDSFEQNSNNSIDTETNSATLSLNSIEEEKNGIEKSRDIDVDLPYKLPEIDYEAIGEFCFESDSLALKGNNDYKNIIEAIVILESQREQAVKDLDALLELKDKALADPFNFVERLNNKEDMKMPLAQKIHPVPSIDWGKYALSGDPMSFRHQQLSRIAADIKKNLKRKLVNSVDFQDNEADDWSSEEENLLKKLLVKFPLEVNQNARWEKIADLLENRSVAQVAHKAQRCFSKLVGSNGIKEKKRKKNFMAKDADQQSDHEDDNGYLESSSTEENSLDSKFELSDEEEIDPELHNTAEYQELLLYKKLLKKRIKASTLTQHLGFRCSWCKCEPILGIRYHCVDCDPALIDFCEDCFGRSYEIGQHTAEHQLEEVHHSNAGFLDRDYMHFLGNDYNYLDPNYMPAT